MDRIVGIDPGVHLCGWAFALNLRILDTGVESDKPTGADVASVNSLVYAFNMIGRMTKPELVIVEHPVIYPLSKADPNDLVRLASVAGVVGAACAVASLGCRLEFVEPRRWKGSVPKDIHNDRARHRSPEAVELVERLPKSQRNHVWDAIALAVWKAERIN